MQRVAFALALAAAASTHALGQNLVGNPDFDAVPILGPGQTPPDGAFNKPINTDPTHPFFVDSISGVPSWTIAFDDPDRQGVDAGLGSDFMRPGQYAHINRWDRPFHQTLADPVAASTLYTVSIDALLLDSGGRKAGRLQLIAGSFVGGVLTPESVVLDEVVFANSEWPLPTDVVLTPNLWTSVGFEFESPSAGSVLGKPLVVAFRTEGGSVGPIYFDNVSVTIPSPSALLPIALLGMRRGNRQR